MEREENELVKSKGKRFSVREVEPNRMREMKWVYCGFDVSLEEEAEKLEVQLVPLEESIFGYVC